MTPIVLPYDGPETPAAVDEALETAQTLIFPTDTVYGIGGNPWDERTLLRVRTLKGRPAGQPFTLHLPAVEDVERFAQLDPRTRAAVARYLPGPYTLLLVAGPDAPPSAVKDGVVGVRVPDHPFFANAMRRIGRPLFGTSVNRSGEPPLNDATSIIDRFGGVDLIVTGPVGCAPSAILDVRVDPPRLVRSGTPADRPSDEKEHRHSGDGEQSADDTTSRQPFLEHDHRNRQQEDRRQ